MTTPTLLLIHGLGATSGVWDGLGDELDWPGPITAPDLPGHGAASWSDSYTLSALATAVAEVCTPDEPVVVAGHSLGGAVGLELASGRYRPSVQGVVGIGIKTTWTDDDVVGMAKVAERGVRWVETRDEAVERFLRQSGLVGLVGSDHPAIDNAVVAEQHDGSTKWRVSQDPATFAQEPLDMAQLLASTQCPVILGAGQHDQMVPKADLLSFTTAPRIADGRGHNAHVEDQRWVAGLVREISAGAA